MLEPVRKRLGGQRQAEAHPKLGLIFIDVGVPEEDVEPIINHALLRMAALPARYTKPLRPRFELIRGEGGLGGAC